MQKPIEKWEESIVNQREKIQTTIPLRNKRLQGILILMFEKMLAKFFVKGECSRRPCSIFRFHGYAGV